MLWKMETIWSLLPLWEKVRMRGKYGCAKLALVAEEPVLSPVEGLEPALIVTERKAIGIMKLPPAMVGVRHTEERP